MKELEAFRDAATAYCELLESANEFETGAFLQRASHRLAAVYKAAIELPTRERAGEVGEVDRKAIEAKVAVELEIGDQLRAKLGKADRFTTVFDVCEDWSTSAHEVEADYGSVANDLAEIYGDLKEALARDDSDDALWDTRFHFDHHWGMHASAVLHPLHQLAWDWEGELD